MSTTLDHSRYWIIMGGLLAASAILVGIGGWIVGEPLTSSFVNTLSQYAPRHAERLLARFLSYESPNNALLAVFISWITSPLSIAAGYLFTARIIKENIYHQAPRTKSRVLIRLCATAVMSVTAIFVVIALPGADSVYCRGCERASMSFMLVVSLLGFYCAGALLGVSTAMLKLILDKTE